MLPEPGDVLLDTESDDLGEVVVVEIAEETAGDYYIKSLDQTVAEYNDCDPDEPVVMAKYSSGRGGAYAFPLSRLEEKCERCDGTGRIDDAPGIGLVRCPECNASVL